MAIQLGIIGGGNMGQAIVRGGIAAKIVPPAQVIVAEIDADRRRVFAQWGCRTTADAREAAAAEQVILAVKPQVFVDVGRAIAPLGQSKVVVSIMAGLHTTRIRQMIGSNARMIRVMPNVACQIGAGMSAIALGDGARPGDEAIAASLFGALGRTVMVDESLMHAVTAVSGSGPAYVFVLAVAMERAGVELGMEPDVATMLVAQTILGAGRLLSESDLSAEALRESVTSPGGTTAAALRVMDQRGFTQTIIDALTAARDRGRELGG